MIYGTNFKAIIISLAWSSPDEEQVEIGIWGKRHLEYIKHHRKGFYTSLVLDCKLNRYLANVNK